MKTLRFYIIPKTGSGTQPDPFRPKYLGEGTLAGIRWSAMTYGQEDTFLVAAHVTNAQHAELSVQSDVMAVPPLAESVGGNPTLNNLRNRLEQQSIPGSWIVATTTYRQVLGRVGRVCMILQRVNGIGKRVFGPGIGLDTTLTLELATDIQNAGASLGLNVSGVTTALTVRQALLLVGDQLPMFTLQGESF